MLKSLSLLISFVLIASGVLSCTTPSLIGNRKKIINQQVVSTVNQNGSYRQDLPKPENENIAVSASLPTKKKPPSIANTENNQPVDKVHIGTLPGVEQEQMKLSPVGLAHFALGIAYAERDLIDQAICEFQSAVEANPHHLESYVQLGTTYGLKGMANEAQSEFKKALDINMDEALAKIVFSAFPVTENQNTKTDIVKAHINLGDACMEKGNLERSRIEYEKALELKPEHPIVSKSLSEIYYSLGTSCLENKEYDNAIDAFNTVLKLNPNFPQIKDSLEKAHYNLGIIYAINGKLNQAIIEFNKTMEMNYHYAMLDNNSLNTISNDKKTVSDKHIRHDRNLPDENTNNSSKSDVRKESFHEEEKPLQYQAPHQIDVAEEIILAEISNEIQDKKQIQEKAVNTGEMDINDMDFVYQERDVSLLANGEEDAENSNYMVYTYNITKNYKTQIGVNEAVKKYEDATINNPYDNNAFLNLAYAYYCKAMYIDDAIARREDAQEGSQNFLVKRFYLNDNAGNEESSNTGLTKQMNTFGNNIVFHNRSGNMYEEMFREAIVEYKSTLRANPNSSSSLYGLAFSFSVKGAHLEIASRDKKKYKKASFR